MECGNLVRLEKSILERSQGAGEQKLPGLFMRCLECCPVFLKRMEEAGYSIPVADDQPVDIVEEMDKFIRANLRMDKQELLKLDNMAQYFMMSKSALKTLFTEKRGIAPHLFIVRCRMEWAMELLTQTHLSINEIAYTLGYDQPWHFSRDFKKFTGMAPTEYRNVI